MAGVTHIKIFESIDELEKLLRQEKNPRLKERLQALYLIKTEQMKVTMIAQVLGRHRGTVQKWLADYREEGIKGMVELGISTGRKRVIPDWAVSSLEKKLKEPEGKFQSYTQIQQWLESALGIQAEYATVHHLTRYKLKAKLKVPRLRHQKQESEKLEAFKKTSPMI